MSIPKDIVRENLGLSDWNIMTCYRGSIAHGMYVPKSDPNSIDDKDVMAVCVPPLERYLSLPGYGYGRRNNGTKEIARDEWDIVVYEARKMLGLLAKSNPNVLMTLWLDPKHYIYKKQAWEMVIDSRELFVSKAAFRSFSGYAHGQLHRMTHHAFEGYMGQKRKKLVDQFGYDTKNAAHLIRILRMGIEFLNDGCLYVERHDAQQLLEIKRGEWALNRVKKEAERLFELADTAYVQSKLPAQVDMGAIRALTVRVVSCALGYPRP